MKKVKRQSTEEEKIRLNLLSLIRCLYLEYIKNPDNPKIKRQITQFKNGQYTWIDTSLRMKYKWPISTLIDAWHH